MNSRRRLIALIDPRKQAQLSDTSIPEWVVEWKGLVVHPVEPTA
jgi:hypothetical protein